MNNKVILQYLVFFKKNIVDLNDQTIYLKIDEYFERSQFLKDIDLLEKNNLILEDNKKYLLYSITEKGERYLKQLDEDDKYNAEKERIEFEKSKIDLVLAQKMLKEYPYTKWLAIIGAIIGILLGLKELSILIKKWSLFY